MLIKKFGTDENFDVIINDDKGDFEIWRNREVVKDDELEDELETYEEDYEECIEELEELEDELKEAAGVLKAAEKACP